MAPPKRDAVWDDGLSTLPATSSRATTSVGGGTQKIYHVAVSRPTPKAAEICRESFPTLLITWITLAGNIPASAPRDDAAVFGC